VSPARFRYGLAAVIALALALRLTAVAATPHFQPVRDAADYDRYAVSLVQHGTFPVSQLAPGPTAFRAPLFPLALAASYQLTGVQSASDRWLAGRLLEAALGAVAVALICLIALRLWGRPTALVAGAIAAIYPPLVLVGSSLMSESLYIPLGLAAVLAALHARDSRPQLWWAVLAGILVGLAALTRATELALLLPVVVLVWSRRPWRALRAVRAPVVVLAATLLTLVPWMVRNLDVMHTFVPITDESGYATLGTYNTYAAHRSDYPALWLPPIQEAAKLIPVARGRNEAQISNRFESLTLDYVSSHPAYPLKVALWSGLRLFNLTGVGFERYIEPTWGYPAWLAQASVYAFWVLGAAALAGAVTRRARRAPWALWLCPVVLLLSTVFVVGATRYRSPADPFFVMLAAVAVTSAAARLHSRPMPTRRLEVRA
jgi:4-amino-4-deoxy-L-arabinose transferase-like glycosyltransferase